jgi:carbon starvation protein
MSRIIFNDYVNATMASLLIALVLTMAGFAIAAILKAYGTPHITARETGGFSAAAAE